MSGVTARGGIRDTPPDSHGLPRREEFERFVAFFRELFRAPDPLAEADCRDSYKEYVPRYYAQLFGPDVRGPGRRHFLWLRRLSGLLELPAGTRILDLGGGYGMDSIFLASCGHRVTFFEITPHHVAIARHLQQRFEARFGPLDIRPVLGLRTDKNAGAVAANAARIGTVDAVMLHEVAHHIEPVEPLFATCAAVLPPGGGLFLLEPNWFSALVQVHFLRVRRFTTVEQRIDEDTGQPYLYGNENIRPPQRWRRLVEPAGFELVKQAYHLPFGQEPGRLTPWWRLIEDTPLLREALATHMTQRFRRKALTARVPG